MCQETATQLSCPFVSQTVLHGWMKTKARFARFVLAAFFLFVFAACGRSTEPESVQFQQTNREAVKIGTDQPIPQPIVAEMLTMADFPLPEWLAGKTNLTLSEAEKIMTELNPRGSQLYTSPENQNSEISYALWVELFSHILTTTPDHEILEVDVIVFGASQGFVETNLGRFSGKAINLSAFIGQEIRIMHRAGEIVGAVAIVDTTPMFTGWVTHTDAFGVTLYVNGRPRNFVYSQGISVLEHETGALYVVVQLVGGEIAKITPTVYRPRVETAIRVQISTNNFGGPVHSSVTITSNGDFVVTTAEEAKTFPAGYHFQVSEKSYIAPLDPAYRLQIIGLQRNWPGGQSPMYRGILEVSPHVGGFTIVNELCLEEYLFSVVPSEMPASHGLEAAKVQAITARSFAMAQIMRNLPVHMCDSVISQVYNNVPETELAIQAVRTTSGQVLTIGGQIVTANYFSTSSGMTANSGEVWAQGGNFPGYTQSHLVSQPQFNLEAHNPGDLSLEENAAAFFRSHDIPATERQFPWFRWQVRLTTEEMSASINASLPLQRAANHALVQVCSEYTTSIGHLTGLEVTRRGQGGNVMEMIFRGTVATVTVQTEFNIRTFLAPRSVAVSRHDGSYVSNMALLPSAFFALEEEFCEAGRLIAVTFFGGGHGHGVGMSQNGVRALVDMGHTYWQILRHFYPGVEVEILTLR